MNAKTVVVGIIILAVVAGGGYFIYKNYNPVDTSGGATAQATDQVQIQDVTVGEGAEATPNSAVSVLYVGRLEDGTVFDSSEAHGNEPLTFVLGTPDLIPGFQIGVNGMKVGGERLFVVPASLAYGAQGVTDAEGKVVVPPNANIIFNVGLVNVAAAAAGAEATTQEGSAEETE